MYLAHPLVGLEAYAPAALPRLLKSKDAVVQKLLDGARRWDVLKRDERQHVLDLIAELVADVRVTLAIGYPSAELSRSETPAERRARTGRRPDRRTRRAKRVPYVSAYIELADEYPRGTGMSNEYTIKHAPFGDVRIEAALYAAWLIDDAEARKKLEAASKVKVKKCPQCEKMFYDRSRTKPQKFCSDECKKAYHRRK